MKSLKQINDFIESQPIAVVGVSRNPKKFGYAAFKELKEKGMKVVPVNPEAIEILGEKVYRNVKELPSDIKGIIVLTKKDQTASVIRDIKEKGIKQVWIQQTADSREALDELQGTDINYVTGECILMHYKPHSFHKFHKAINKFFGLFPK
jgi:uncharacterized protein